MPVQVLRCPNCGAELEIVDGVETLRCKFCGVRCQLGGRGATAQLRLINAHLERIEGHTRRAAEDLQVMRAQHSVGVVSQLAADAEVSATARAQQEAASEVARAARLAAAREETMLRAHAAVATATEADITSLTKLRSKARRWRWFAWLGLILVPVAAVGVLFAAGLVASLTVSKEQRPWLGPVLAVSILLSPLYGVLWVVFGLRRRRKLASAYNDRAFLYGLDEIPLKR